MKNSNPIIENICILNKQRKYCLNINDIIQLVRYVLNKENIPKNIGLNIMFVNNKKIKYFNNKFLNVNMPTDVISFEGEKEMNSVGDIIISVEKAYNYSKKNNIDFNEELKRYIIHGILHCLGYDDIENENRKKMFKRQEQLLKHKFIRKIKAVNNINLTT